MPCRRRRKGNDETFPSFSKKWSEIFCTPRIASWKNVYSGGCCFVRFLKLSRSFPMSEPAPTARQRLEYFGWWCGAQAVKRLPYFSLRHLANILGAIACFLDGRGRRVAEANLTAALGVFPT